MPDITNFIIRIRNPGRRDKIVEYLTGVDEVFNKFGQPYFQILSEDKMLNGQIIIIAKPNLDFFKSLMGDRVSNYNILGDMEMGLTENEYFNLDDGDFSIEYLSQ